MTAKGNNGATLGFEETLWQAADKPAVNADRSSRSAELRRLEDEIRKTRRGWGSICSTSAQDGDNPDQKEDRAIVQEPLHN